MRKSKILLLLLLIMLSAIFCVSCVMGAPSVNTCSAHRDFDKNYRCDLCGAAIPFVCSGHSDDDHDGKCDVSGCGASVFVSHTDLDHDGKCDGLYCEQELTVIHEDLDENLVCDVCEAELSAKESEKETCDKCVDSDENFVCDICGEKIIKEKLSLIKNGVANFRIVIASELLQSSEVIYAADKLVGTIRSLGVTVGDWEAEDASAADCEVLIGNCEYRDAAFCEDPHIYGPKGYSIRVLNGKIVIIAGSKKAYSTALLNFGEQMLGIDGKNKIRNVTVTDYDDIIEIQDDYKVKSVTLMGEELRRFRIVCDDEVSRQAALLLQELFYEKCGYWLEVSEAADGEGVLIIDYAEKTGGDGFCANFAKGRIEFVCEYSTVIKNEILKFFILKFAEADTALDFTAADSYVKNVRDVYYNDFGAKGDGVTDDLLAIIAAHEYANEGGHRVFANPGYTYYIGNNNGKNHFSGAIIKTDTDWTDAKFIIDDSDVSKDALDGGVYARLCEIFSIRASVGSYSVLPSNISVSSLNRKSTNIGYAPGYRAVVEIRNNTQKNYIRYGVNANSGETEREVVLVDKDGNIDPSTPLMWDYEVISGYVVYYAEDEPITVKGGSFTTVYNNQECVYEPYSRAIWVRRSNVTVKDVVHENLGEGDTGCPSGGFTVFRGCSNVLFENITYDNMKSFYQEKNGESVLMGSYEIAGQSSVNVTWKNCVQSDFWRDEEKKYAKAGGIMGTSYNKNLFFLGCTLSSFDAHAGVWNVTIKDSEIEHINCIGGGVARIENTRIHTMYQKNAIMLRGDYGSLWMGDFYFIDCTLVTEKSIEVALFDASWANHDFGFDYGTSMPTRVYVENVTIESEDGLNVLRLVEQYVGQTAASGEKTVWSKPIFEDFVDGVKNINPYKITEEWIIKDNKGYIYLLPPAFTTEISIERIEDG